MDGRDIFHMAWGGSIVVIFWVGATLAEQGAFAPLLASLCGCQ